MKTTDEIRVTEAEEERFQQAIAEVLEEVKETFRLKGHEYDNDGPIWHRMPFGMKSWLTHLLNKSSRLVSMARLLGEKPNKQFHNNLIDLAVYTIACLAWSKLGFSERSSDKQEYVDLIREGATNR